MKKYFLTKTTLFIFVLSLCSYTLIQAQNLYPTNVNSSLYLDGGSILMNKPDAPAGWARGILNVNSDNTTLGGVGLMGSGDDLVRYFIGFGERPWGADKEGIFIVPSGNVGIGVINPKAELHIGEQLLLRSTSSAGGWGGISKNAFWDIVDQRTERVLNDESAEMAFTSDGDIVFRTAPAGGVNTAISFTRTMTIKNEGGVDVCGIIRAKEVLVEEGWCDFVFEPGYSLTSLEEEEKFIEQYGHLSNFESAKAMNGEINVNDIFKRQQIQIEENVLHLIEANEENNDLQFQVADLTDNVEQLNAEVTTLTANYQALVKELAAIKAQLK